MLQALDRAAWRVLAEAYAAWLSRTGTWQTPEHVLAAWEKAVDGRIDLPARVRS